jgi:hypothetical protein
LADRKSFLIRMDPQVLDAVRRWADDDLRSVNGQIEFLLRRALRDSGRLTDKTSGGRHKRSASGSRKQNPENP